MPPRRFLTTGEFHRQLVSLPAIVQIVTIGIRNRQISEVDLRVSGGILEWRKNSRWNSFCILTLQERQPPCGAMRASESELPLLGQRFRVSESPLIVSDGFSNPDGNRMIQMRPPRSELVSGFPEDIGVVLPMGLQSEAHHLVAFHEKLPDALVVEVHGANGGIGICDEQVQW